MQFISTGPEFGFIAVGHAPVGVIAIGGLPVGVIAIGFIATGVVAISCGFSRGVVAISCGVGIGGYVRVVGAGFGFYVNAVGLAVGFYTEDESDVGGFAHHPYPSRQRVDDPSIPLDAILERRETAGWVRLRIGSDDAGRSCLMHAKKPLDIELSDAACEALVDQRRDQVLAYVQHQDRSKPVGYRDVKLDTVLTCDRIKPIPPTPSRVVPLARWWTGTVLRVAFALAVVLSLFVEFESTQTAPNQYEIHGVHLGVPWQ